MLDSRVWIVVEVVHCRDWCRDWDWAMSYYCFYWFIISYWFLYF